MTRLTLEQKLRTAHVKRWQIVRVGREQTLAEHHYLVYHIAVEVIKVIHGKIPAFGEQANVHLVAPDEMRDTIEWALTHDIPEVITGDIATPAKRAMREAVPHDDPLRRIELQLDDRYAELYLKLKHHVPYILLVVKLADVLEAMRFLAFEGQGKQAREALLGIYGAYLNIIDEAMRDHPQYAWCAVTTLIFSEIVLPELDAFTHGAVCTAGVHRQGGTDAFAKPETSPGN